MFGKQNTSRIAARHDPLRHVNSSSGEIGLIIHICDGIDWPTMDADPQFKSRIAL